MLQQTSVTLKKIIKTPDNPASIATAKWANVLRKSINTVTHVLRNVISDKQT